MRIAQCSLPVEAQFQVGSDKDAAPMAWTTIPRATSALILSLTPIYHKNASVSKAPNSPV